VIILIWALIALVLLLLAATVAGVREVRRGVRESRHRDAAWSSVNRLTREKLVVTLKSGAAFEGVLYEADERTWILRGVFALGAGDNGENVPVDGELLLFVVDIAYAQKP
jgi:hypothetical protein